MHVSLQFILLKTMCQIIVHVSKDKPIFFKVLADPGNIGGSLSHEYHVTAPVGDDILVTCLRYIYMYDIILKKLFLMAKIMTVSGQRCGSGSSIEVLGCETKSHLPNCPEDGSNCELTQTKGIEVS